MHAPQLPDGPVVERALLAALPEHLRQPAFVRTGGMHATGLFTAGGELVLAREDVGRHNAMDKVVGRALRDGLLPLHGRILCVSGRLSFELVQKAAVAGAPILVGVGAPTSLAIALAADRNMTLAGFARGDSVNVYSGAERVQRDARSLRLLPAQRRGAAARGRADARRGLRAARAPDARGARLAAGPRRQAPRAARRAGDAPGRLPARRDGVRRGAAALREAG